MIEDTVAKLFARLRMPVSKNYICKLITTHPDYPSLLSVVDAFKRLNLEFEISRISRHSHHQLAKPHLIHNGKELLLIRNKYDIEQNATKLSDTCVAIRVERTNEIINAENKAQLKQERIQRAFQFISLMVPLLLVGLIVPHGSLWEITYLLSCIPGIIIGYSLVMKDLGVTNWVTTSFCGQKNSGCDKVSKSDSIKIFKYLKPADLVHSYFIYQLISVSFLITVSSLKSTIFTVMIVNGACSVPIVLASLYQQQFKVKAWCKLCLAVDAILILQFLLLLSYNTFTKTDLKDISLSYVAANVLLFIFITALLFLIKEKNKTHNESSASNVRLSRLKNSFDLVLFLLEKEHRVNALPLDNEICLGNSIAPVKILMVSNLFCKPCKAKFQSLIELLNIYPDHVMLSIRFLHDANDKSNATAWLIDYWFENIQQKENESYKTIQLLIDWFECMDLVEFSKKYRAPKNKYSKRILDQHEAWARQSKIFMTPITFINGFQLPHYYSVDELAMLIPDLSAHFEKQNQFAQNEMESLAWPGGGLNDPDLSIKSGHIS